VVGHNRTRKVTLHRSHSKRELIDQARIISELIMRRISMLEQLDQPFPFAIPTPLPTDILPSHDGSQHTVSSGLCVDDATPSENVSVKLTSHARMAQSIFLLSYVIEYVKSTSSSPSPHDAACLDRSIRSFMMALLQDDIKHHQGPYTICLR